MSQHYRIGAIIHVFILWTCLAWAQSAHATTLGEFVHDAVQADPQVREQVHVYRQILQDRTIALSGWRPSLDISASTGIVSKKAPSSRDFSSSQIDITLTQNLFNGFDTTNQIEQAKARMTSVVFRLFDTADNTALEAVRAYMDVLSERKLVELARQNVESHERIFAQIREQSRAGIGRRSEIEQTEGRLAGAQASLVSQQNNFLDALTQLHKVLGRYLDPNTLEDPETPPMPTGALEELIDQSLTQHPALESARKNIEAAYSDYRRSRHTNLPRLDLQLQQSAGDDVGSVAGSHSERSVLLSLKYNLYRGGADEAEQQKKISAINEHRAFRQRVQRQVIDTLRLAWAADRALNEQLPFLRTHVEKARETVALYEEEFFLQKRDLLDLLDAESELNSARKRNTESYYESLVARFRVYEGLGRLFEVLGLKVEATQDDLRIADIRAKGADSIMHNPDTDRDGAGTERDQCDNSLVGGKVNSFGCGTTGDVNFGYVSENRAPTALPDTLTANAGTALDIAPTELLANDIDPDGDSLTITGHDNPSRGSLMSDAEGYLVYAPSEGFHGSDIFSYTISDGKGGVSSAKVTVQVAPAAGEPPNRASGKTADDVEYLRFGYKQTGLTAESEAILDVYAKQLRAFPAATLEIRAYTDNIGSAAYNRRLSSRRAEQIKRLLVNRGIPGHRVSAIGMGEDNPIADNSTEEGRARNRRAELDLQLSEQN